MLRSMWSAPPEHEVMIRQTAQAGIFDGVEGPIPTDPQRRQELKRMLDDHGFMFVAECTTGLTEGRSEDWWVPDPAKGVEDHLADLRWCCEHLAEMGGRFITTMCGYDAWGWSENEAFFGRAIELEQETGVRISYETHRCRSMFNPWITRDLLRRFPEMRITCDFSHWCVVAERLIGSESDTLDLCANHAHHVHARVGNAQAAQVNDPRAPEHHRALAEHEDWWERIWRAQRRRGMRTVTMTAEWGAEGYTPHLPYTDVPVVDLWAITKWMASRERERFERWLAEAQGKDPSVAGA